MPENPPPVTGPPAATRAPGPRSVVPVIALVVVALVFLVAVVVAVVWSIARPSSPPANPARDARAFASAMRKAGVGVVGVAVREHDRIEPFDMLAQSLLAEVWSGVNDHHTTAEFHHQRRARALIADIF